MYLDYDREQMEYIDQMETQSRKSPLKYKGSRGSKDTKNNNNKAIPKTAITTILITIEFGVNNIPFFALKVSYKALWTGNQHSLNTQILGMLGVENMVTSVLKCTLNS